VRTYFKYIIIDENRCCEGSGENNFVEVLKAYSKKFDQDRKVYSNIPDHNWESHGADSFGEGIRYIDRQYKHLLEAEKLNGESSVNIEFYKAKKMVYAERTKRLLEDIKRYG
jgi:hypothetical protein